MAIGAAVYAENTGKSYTYQEIMAALEQLKYRKSENRYLEPLFHNQAEYDQFVQRHQKNHVKVVDPAAYQGNVYLGIDVGSTTSKIALIGE